MIVTMVGLLAAGQVAATTAPTAGKPTLQQQFDTASDAATQNRCADALTQFAAIENAPPFRRNGVASAAIQVRKGRCLVLTGRTDEGEAAIRRGLPAIEAQGAAFANDVRDARLVLGSAAAARFDYAAAARDFEAALARSTGAYRIVPLSSLAGVLMFDRDGAALRHVTEARDLTLATPSLKPREVAVVQTQYARVLLNEGRKKEAYDELKASLKKQGGLTLKVGFADIVTRSDLAIAAVLNGDREAAQRYLAYTGAGRMPDSPFGRAVQMQPPSCGGAGGLKPDDYAIVEFMLGDDGRVANAAPIYTTGGRAVAIEFARAVKDWWWRPDDVKAMPPLFRTVTRIEIRCTNAGDRATVLAPIVEAYDSWLASKGRGEAEWTGKPDVIALPLQRAALARAEAGGDAPAMIQALAAIAASAEVSRKDSLPPIVRALSLAESADAPIAATTFLALGREGIRNDRADSFRQGLRALLADPARAADPLSAATLRLSIAMPRDRAPAPDDAATLLTAVIDAPGLPVRHPLKVNAMLQQANVLGARGDMAAARAMFDRTGLSEEQCAMIGLTPAVRRTGASSADYPDAAMRMGFEGWVMNEFDVAADGTTVSPRPIVAYPPFVFNEAATGIARDARYASTFRPTGGVACAANRQPIRFQIP